MPVLTAVLTILFIASFIRSAFGFGEALIAVPLLAFAMPVDTAAPIAALASITVATVAIAQDWRHIHFRSAGRLFLATAVGTPLGLWALHALDEHLVKMVLGAVVMAFSVFALMRHRQVALHDDRHAWIFGFGAGTFRSLMAADVLMGNSEQPSATTPPTTIAGLALELGRPAVMVILIAAFGTAVLLIRGALKRGRDSFFPALGAAAVLALVAEAFADASLFSTTTIAIDTAVLGLAIAQSASRSGTI